ncbi:MAG: TesB-like acyl-CoA thioesterase 5, partial [uncultured Solirubrobacteraceae bacterium]
ALVSDGRAPLRLLHARRRRRVRLHPADRRPLGPAAPARRPAVGAADARARGRERDRRGPDGAPELRHPAPRPGRAADGRDPRAAPRPPRRAARGDALLRRRHRAHARDRLADALRGLRGRAGARPAAAGSRGGPPGRVRVLDGRGRLPPRARVALRGGRLHDAGSRDGVDAPAQATRGRRGAVAARAPAGDGRRRQRHLGDARLVGVELRQRRHRRPPRPPAGGRVDGDGGDDPPRARGRGTVHERRVRRARPPRRDDAEPADRAAGL